MNRFHYPRYLIKSDKMYTESFVVERYHESVYFNNHKPLTHFRLYDYFNRMPVYVVKQNWKHHYDWDKAEILLQKDVEEMKDWMEVRDFEVRCYDDRYLYCIMEGGDFD
ncbi:MAG: hypothetical protein J5621_08570 [Paludibacteraceae bacterium]|nr:hypothetical protein [Paludibacteraceae bacterium]